MRVYLTIWFIWRIIINYKKKNLTFCKGKVPEHVQVLGGAGFNDSWTATNASAPCVEARQDELSKEYATLGAKPKSCKPYS